MPTVVSTRLVRDGRRVRNSECELVQDGRPVVGATLVQYRRSSAPKCEEWRSAMDFPRPDVDDTRYTRIGSDKGLVRRDRRGHGHPVRQRRALRVGHGYRRKQPAAQIDFTDDPFPSRTR